MSLEHKIRQNLQAIQHEMAQAADRAGRSASDITFVAVTKSVGLDEMRILHELGVTHFGENRVDVARAKMDAFSGDDITWHMVGNIQRRKAKDVLQLFDIIDAVDRMSLAEELQRRCQPDIPRARVLVEVNVSGEAQKHGFTPDQVDAALQEMASLDRLQIDGLMTMAPFGIGREERLGHFRTLRALADRHGLHEASMGMSGDFQEAIEAGATQVRIGRALFD